MIARAVIGANFGDEGKGLATDYLCRQGADVVVRFNGGAQAGHTVVTADGRRHVFGHFGSGSFAGVPTFLSHFFVVNPMLFQAELLELEEKNVKPVTYVHPDCLVTTPLDMEINQATERQRGAFGRHGSCGIGFNETIQRHKVLPFRMRDIWDETVDIDTLLEKISGGYAINRLGARMVVPMKMRSDFITACNEMAEFVLPASMREFNSPLFEGAQGLLLDRDHPEYFPHLTNSKTGMHNVRLLCKQAKIDSVEPWYISRTYLTRHGAGPLPGENPKLSYPDETNKNNPWQGPLRFAPLDTEGLLKRIAADASEIPPRLMLTHCDQVAPTCEANRYVYGPTESDIYLHEMDHRNEKGALAIA